MNGLAYLSESTPSFPTEEYIAGRERGRIAGLKGILKVRVKRISAGAILGGVFAATMIASPATTGHRSFSYLIALSIFACFLALGCFGVWTAVLSYRRSMHHLRDDIVRSVMAPDDAAQEPGRLQKWWMRGEASSDNPWERSAADRGNNPNRKY
jgi:MFS family permease